MAAVFGGHRQERAEGCKSVAGMAAVFGGHKQERYNTRCADADAQTPDTQAHRPTDSQTHNRTDAQTH